MRKSVSSSLIYLSGIIYVILGAVNMVGWILLWFFMQGLEAPPAFILPFLDIFMYALQTPSQLIVLFLIMIIGLVFIIAAKKIRKEDNLLRWTIISFVLGVFILFEIGFRGMFGGMTAGILAITGSIFGLIELSRK